MEILERLPSEFSSDDVYRHEMVLSQRFPRNHHIKDKIRQQLQYLRDDGLVEFVDDAGLYRKTRSFRSGR